MKKRGTLLIVVLIFIVAGIFVGYETKDGEWFMKNPSQDTTAVSASVSSINQQDNFYNINVEYPQFKNVSPEFNKKIYDSINSKLENFKKEAKDNWDARMATASPDNPVPENPEESFPFLVSWNPAQTNNKYISFVMNIYSFVGGAHGATEIDTFNYDFAKNKEISILDFLGSQDNLNKLSVLCAQRIKDQLTGQGIPMDDFLTQMITDGTTPTIDNFSAFTFNQNSVTIYFQQYQVAPGAVGEINITLYKTELEQDSIKTNYLQ